MTASTSAQPPRRDHDAFQRMLGLALWAQAQQEPFSFEEVRDAFGEAYEGSFSAVDRKWSRDKKCAAALGAPLELRAADRYLVSESAQPARLRLSAGDAAVLQAFVRELPVRFAEPDGPHLELGLRKLLLRGAPIRDALWDRHLAGQAAGGAPAAALVVEAQGKLLTTVERRVRVGAVLHELLLQAGPSGLPISEALVLSGAADAADLEAVIAHLTAMACPLPPPADSLGIERFGGRVAAYLPVRRARRVALVAEEIATLDAAAASLSSGLALEPLKRMWRVSARQPVLA